MNKRYAAAAKFAAAALFSILAVVLAASIFVMIVSANERYRVAGDFAQFLYWLYTLRGAATAAGVMSALCEIPLFAYLICAAGHSDKSEGVTLGFWDRVPLEVCLLIYALALWALLWEVRFVLACVTSPQTLVFLWLLAPILFWAMAIVCSAFMTFAARIKAGTFFKNTLVWRCCRGLWRLCRAVVRGLCVLPVVWRSALFVTGVLVLNVVLARGSWYDDGYFFTIMAIDAFVLVICLRFVFQFRQLCGMSERLAAGELDSHLDTSRMHFDLKRCGDDLNRIGGAAAIAVNERMRSERFRTELITNVSHDLKTPLTALISYIDLMKREGVNGEHAEEYLNVLDRQSQRLKKLTEDLVEASKAASGTLPVSCAPMNLEEFIRQCTGEYEEELKKRDLTLVVGDMHDLRVMADGRHIWRVFDNLLGNVRKYAMPGTRVYIDAFSDGRQVAVLVRNISKNQLNISPDELMERFVRGDASRGETEGSGLGLSIATSLMKLQNGDFRIFINGDMFTARVTLPQAPNEPAIRQADDPQLLN